MSLFVVATPIGNPEDITLRALETLKSVDLVIGEERREALRLLKRLQIEKPLELLNEHSSPQEISGLIELCRTQKVALISDCGTPAFCDPGARLISRCHDLGISVTAVPGPSSLMTLLSIAGADLSTFLFLGFLPVEKELRRQLLQSLRAERRPVVLMDTPYRLTRLLEELATHGLGKNLATIGLNLTAPEERLLRGQVVDLARGLAGQKAEFVLILYPLASA